MAQPLDRAQGKPLADRRALRPYRADAEFLRHRRRLCRAISARPWSTTRPRASASLVKGRVFDGTGTPLRDALVEIWQADAAGLYNRPAEMRGAADPNFTGWGR